MSTGAAVSVILRTLERNERLSEALESLVNQTRRDFEVVVVDMNKGNTAPVLERFYTQLPHLRHLLIGKPLPRAEALNEGISHATADKIAILDDDNLYDPIHLAVLVQGLERTGADLVYTGVRGTTYTPAGHLMDVAIWHQLSERELATKILARDQIYTTLIDQMGPVLSELPRAHLGLEVMAPACVSVPELMADIILRYEWRARMLAERGDIEQIITYRQHYLPVASALLKS